MMAKLKIISLNVVILLFSVGELLASEQAPVLPPSGSFFELLSKAKISTVSEHEIDELSTEESKKHTDDGYLANPGAVDCFDALGYRYKGGRYNNDLIRFRLRCPLKIKPNKKYPLVVWFHGKGESGNDNERQLAHIHYALPSLVGTKSLDFFMLITQCPQDNQSWLNSISQEGKGDSPFTIATEIFEHILEEYPIDRKRISTFGMCSGGAASWAFARKYPELCSAIVAISTTPPPELTFTDFAISAYHCTGDDIPIQPMRDYVGQINQKGGNARLTELDVESHDAWTPALSQYKVLAWMIRQKKNSLFSPPPGEVLEPLLWRQVFFYYGLPVCCLVILFVVRLWRGRVV
ncbi:MAG: hypothetical protein LBJ00_08695 [Planctomycetaceae bacterium]|jgi:predicted peptidase|nr:hypothetical protein [Planctomycetaceae bacterium]